MNWFKTSQNNTLYNNIYQLLVSIYNNTGQGNELLSSILNQPIDIYLLDMSLLRAKNQVMKDLNIGVLTPEMQSAIDTIVSSLRSSPNSQEQVEEKLEIVKPIEPESNDAAI